MNTDIDSIKQKLVFYFKHHKNVLIEGRHGTGKTSLISEVFNQNCKKWLYFSGSTLDPWVDFIGIPKEIQKNGKSMLSFVLPEAMCDEKIEAIFIDEYNRTHEKVRNGTMELIQFKSINGRKFPNLKVVWVAINPIDSDEDLNYDVEEIDDAQLDRFQIKITMPNNPDFDYFAQKFGKPNTTSAFEWWNALPPKVQKKISPRRLDYGLEVYSEGGDLMDVFPIESNPVKLLATLRVGSLEKKVSLLFKSGVINDAISFLNDENNYQGSLPIIRKNEEYIKYFVPLLDKERISSLFFMEEDFKKFILKNPVYFKEALEEISKLKAIEPTDLANIGRSLKKLGSITYFK
jgi:hypothetical protein